MTTDLADMIIRPFRPDDRDFIEASWIDSFKDGCVSFINPAVTAGVYYPGQRYLVRRLTMPKAIILVAVTPDYDDAILGWVVAALPNVLHYIYVKTVFRENGIAKALLAKAGLDLATLTYSHVTRRGKDIIEKYPGATFNPWVLTGDFACQGAYSNGNPRNQATRN